MSSRFYFGDEDDSASSDDNLPYPKPLTRASFLTPDFDPTTFLSTLHNRHQTLEDLRAELRTRNQELNKELLDLVNNNYQDFLGLGSRLKGGDEKVEEVRLGLLGFRREVEVLKGKVEGRRKEVEELVDERKAVREQVQVGRGLLEVDRKIEELEERLMLASKHSKDDLENGEDHELSGSEEESDEAEEGTGIPVLRLRKHVEQYLQIQRSIARLGSEHPFLVRQEERVLRLKQTVLLDLSSALKQAAGISDENRASQMQILAIYKQMGEEHEAMAVLKKSRGQRP